jgi:hypothetical protein
MSVNGMSALGQKQTFAVQNVMSALPPKAEIDATQTDVRYWANSGLFAIDGSSNCICH